MNESLTIYLMKIAFVIARSNSTRTYAANENGIKIDIKLATSYPMRLYACMVVYVNAVMETGPMRYDHFNDSIAINL